MTISITREAMLLSCDSCGNFRIFTSPDGYIGQHRDAMAQGWLERQGPQGRLWFCPQCSNKQTKP
jgi:hypothetical protein